MQAAPRKQMAPARRFNDSDDEDEKETGRKSDTRSDTSILSLPDLGLDLESSRPSTQRKAGESGPGAEHSTESGGSERPSERPSAPPPPAQLSSSERIGRNSPPLSSLTTTASSSDSKRAETQLKPADTEPKGEPLDIEAINKALLDQVGRRPKKESDEESGSDDEGSWQKKRQAIKSSPAKEEKPVREKEEGSSSSSSHQATVQFKEQVTVMGGVTPQTSDRKPGVQGGQQQSTQASPEPKPVAAPVPHPPASGARKASSSSSMRSSTASLRAPHAEREPDQKVSPSSTSTSGSSQPADARHVRPSEHLEREPTMYAEKTNSESEEAPEERHEYNEIERGGQRQPEGGGGGERESAEEGATEPKRESEGGAAGGGKSEEERVLVSRGKRFHAMREGELRASPRDDEDEDDEDYEEREAGAADVAPAEAEGEQRPAEEVGDEQPVEKEPSTEAEAEGGEENAEKEEAKRARKERQQRLLKLRMRRVRSAAIEGGLRPPPESLDAWGEDEGDGAEEENGKKLPSVNASGGSRPGSAYMSPYSLSPEMKKLLEKRKYNEQRKKEEAKKRDREKKNSKQSDLDDIWRSWKKKIDQRQREREREEAKLKSREERKSQAYKEDLSLTVDDWLQKVKRREKRERQRAQFLEQEENMFIRVRSQDECDRAFRQWLQRKRMEAEEQARLEAERAAFTRELMRLTQRNRELAALASNDHAGDYYGYRF